MARRSTIICDYCGAEAVDQQFYSVHDFAEGNPPPKFVVVEVRAQYNNGKGRFMRYVEPKYVRDRTRRGEGSTNGTIRLELCLDCVVKPLFEMLDIRDPEPDKPDEGASADG